MVVGRHPLPRRGPCRRGATPARTAPGPCRSRTRPRAPPRRPWPRRSGRSRRPGTGWPCQIPLGSDPPLERSGRHDIGSAVMPSGPNTSRLASLSRLAPATVSTTRPRSMRVEIAVLGGVAGRRGPAAARTAGRSSRLRLRPRLQVERDVALEAAGVVQQHAHGHLVLESAGEAGQDTGAPAHRGRAFPGPPAASPRRRWLTTLVIEAMSQSVESGSGTRRGRAPGEVAVALGHRACESRRPMTTTAPG